jgi:hypothetical protein
MTLSPLQRNQCLKGWMTMLASGDLPAAAVSASTMPPDVLRYGIARTVEGWMRDESRWSLMAAEPDEGGAVIQAVLPSNSPAPLLNLLASAWLRGARLTLKPAGADHAFVAAICDWTRAALEGFAIEIVAAAGGPCDLLAVYGSDETIAEMRAAASEAPTAMRYEGYGHRWSIAVSVQPPGAGVTTPGGVAGVRAGVDIVTWNQFGCLSPLVLLVPRSSCAIWADALAEQLSLHEAVAPRGPAPAATLLAIHTARMDARARGCEVRAPEVGTAWTVIVEKTLRVEPTPAARTIRLAPFDDLEEVLSAIEPSESELEAVGVAAPDDVFAALVRRFAHRPGWIVRLGEMQSPPLLRSHGRRESLVELIPLRSGVASE